MLERIGSFARRRSGWVIWGTLLLSLLLLFPVFALAPTQRASDEPGGAVFDIGDEVEDKFPPAAFSIPFVVEARDGDILTQKELWELYQNEKRLRESELGREFLYSRYDVESGRMTRGVYTIADAVQDFFIASFPGGVTLENATDEQVKLAIHYVAAQPGSSGMIEWFSVNATREARVVAGQPIDYWVSPAFVFSVNADNEKLLKDYARRLPPGYSEILVKEHFSREVQKLLRGGEESYQLWGIAIDLNLESEEEGKTSIPLIIAAVVVILVVVTIHFKSFQVNLLTLLGLILLLIWLKGLSNLMGLKSSLILDIIVPVAILVLGVDYAIHSLHRYREEREKGSAPGTALGNSIAGVGGALVLAMLTTVVAFLANVSSGIESIIGFGIAAAVAIFSALIIMGLFLPTLKMRLDARRWMRRAARAQPGKEAAATSSWGREDRPRGALLGKIVCSLADRRAIVLPLALLITGISFFYASRLEAKLDAREFFNSKSDFVVSLDKLDEHVGQKGGEPAIIYIKGDLSEPEALLAIQNLIRNMDDDRTVARRSSDGRPNVYASIFKYLEAVLSNELAIARIEASHPDISLTDANGDGIPDTREQLRAIYDYIVQEGIPLDENTLRYEPSRIKEDFFHDPSGKEGDATLVVIGIPGTREQAVVKESREELLEDMSALEGVESISFAGLAGTGYERDVTLDAITRSLNTSIIIAVIACMVILLIAFRSLKYSLVTVIPVLLVATWLYAVMYLGGFHLNAVTATIAAISIGVGIDYSVHITVRFRQELGKTPDRRTAIERAARESGSALFGSAASTMFGFVIIGFAPMPMFSSFGRLTALMILMALVAALLVLPSLLLLIAGGKPSPYPWKHSQ
jgi:predicted RND superfamily exporter protein